MPNKLPKQRSATLRKSGSQSSKRRPLWRRIILLQLFLAAVFFLHLYQNVFVVEQGLQLEGLRKELAEQESIRQDLRVASLSLSSPSRVASVAQNKLGMVKPPAVAYVKPVPESDVDPRVREETKRSESAQISMDKLWALVRTAVN